MALERYLTMNVFIINREQHFFVPIDFYLTVSKSQFRSQLLLFPSAPRNELGRSASNFSTLE